MPEGVANGSVKYTSVAVGSKAVYGCDLSFKLVGSEVRTCQENLQWTPQLPACEGESIMDGVR